MTPIEVGQERAARWSSVGVVILWSGSGVFAELATGRYSALEAAWWESLCGLVFVSAVAWRSGVPRQLPRLAWADAGRLTILGLLAHTGYYSFLFLGFAAGHEVETMALNYTWAVFMVVFGVLINRLRLTWSRAISVLLGALGAMLVVMPDPSRVEPISWGSVAGLGAGLSFGLFTPLAVRWKYDPRLVTWWMMVVSFAGFSCAMLRFDVPVAFHAVSVAGAAYLGVGVDGIGYVLWQRANRVLPPWVLAVWSCLIPVVNLSLIRLVFGFGVSGTLFVGATLVIGGILVQQIPALTMAREARRTGGRGSV